VVPEPAGTATTEPSSRTPKVLLVTDRAPGVAAGYEIRIGNVIEGLLAAGDLHVCLIDSGEDVAPFPVDPRYQRSVVRAVEPPKWKKAIHAVFDIPHLRYEDETAVRERVRDSVGDREWDAVWFSRARAHRLCGDLVRGRHILDLDDLNDELLRTLRDDRKARLRHRRVVENLFTGMISKRWRTRYQQISAQVARLVVCSPGDRRRLDLPNIAVVPNGYPLPTSPVAPLTPSPAPSARHTMLFVGPLTYEPNYLGVKWMIDEVIDLIRREVPNAELAVIGEDGGASTSLQHPAVSFHGLVPDVTPYYEVAHIAVAPIHSGGGTRLKVLEAMARKRPLVSTSFACSGLDLRPERDLLVARSADEFARACVELLEDDCIARDIADHAHVTYLRHHRAEACSAAVTALVEAVLCVASGPSRGTER